MRLLYVSHSFPPPDRPLSNVGGMQRVATELYGALTRRDDVELLPVVLRSSWRWTHVRAPLFLFRTAGALRRHLARRDVDAVLFSSMVTASLAVPLADRFSAARVPAAAIVHGRDVTLDVAPYQRFVPRVFGALDAVLPVSRATGAACLERGLAPGRLFVVPNGIDVDRFERPAVRSQARAALPAAIPGGVPLPEGSLLLCSVGRQVRRKGFAWFVDEVMPRLPAHVHYWLAGEGPEADEIRAAAERRSLGARVRLLGRVTEAQLAALYQGADLFVMPNIPVPGDMEGFGVVMLEAGLCGLPSVAARLEGIIDVIRDGVNGHFVASGDAEGYAAVIRRYDEHRDELRAASERAAEYVAATFSWEAVAGRYVELLQGLDRRG